MYAHLCILLGILSIPTMAMAMAMSNTTTKCIQGDYGCNVDDCVCSRGTICFIESGEWDEVREKWQGVCARIVACDETNRKEECLKGECICKSDWSYYKGGVLRETESSMKEVPEITWMNIGGVVFVCGLVLILCRIFYRRCSLVYVVATDDNFDKVWVW